MYSDKVMDHFQNPRNVGEIENASGVGTVGNAKCGDIMKVYLDIENGIIKDEICSDLFLGGTLMNIKFKLNEYNIIKRC